MPQGSCVGQLLSKLASQSAVATRAPSESRTAETARVPLRHGKHAGYRLTVVQASSAIADVSAKVVRLEFVGNLRIAGRRHLLDVPAADAAVPEVDKRPRARRARHVVVDVRSDEEAVADARPQVEGQCAERIGPRWCCRRYRRLPGGRGPARARRNGIVPGGELVVIGEGVAVDKRPPTVICVHVAVRLELDAFHLCDKRSFAELRAAVERRGAARDGTKAHLKPVTPARGPRAVREQGEARGGRAILCAQSAGAQRRDVGLQLVEGGREAAHLAVAAEDEVAANDEVAGHVHGAIAAGGEHSVAIGGEDQRSVGLGVLNDEAGRAICAGESAASAPVTKGTRGFEHVETHCWPRWRTAGWRCRRRAPSV